LRDAKLCAQERRADFSNQFFCGIGFTAETARHIAIKARLAA